MGNIFICPWNFYSLGHLKHLNWKTRKSHQSKKTRLNVFGVCQNIKNLFVCAEKLIDSKSFMMPKTTMKNLWVIFSIKWPTVIIGLQSLPSVVHVVVVNFRHLIEFRVLREGHDVFILQQLTQNCRLFLFSGEQKRIFMSFFLLDEKCSDSNSFSFLIYDDAWEKFSHQNIEWQREERTKKKKNDMNEISL